MTIRAIKLFVVLVGNILRTVIFDEADFDLGDFDISSAIELGPWMKLRAA